MAGSESEREIAAALLAYLEDNAEASDTLEGIAQWWLMRQRVVADVVAVERVLRRLTARGILEQTGAPANPRYRLKRRIH